MIVDARMCLPKYFVLGFFTYLLYPYMARACINRRRLSRRRHRAQKQDRTCNFFVERVDKPTDNKNLAVLCHRD
jgi:hypothetical protein